MDECKPLPDRPGDRPGVHGQRRCGLGLLPAPLAKGFAHSVHPEQHALWMKWCKLDLQAEVERSMSHFSFKRSVPGGFNLGFMDSTCTASPGMTLLPL